MRPPSPGPSVALALALSLLLALPIAPPETSGLSMAGGAGLVVALLAANALRGGRRQGPLLLAVLGAAVLALLATSPGAAVLPLCTAVLALAAARGAAGIAAGPSLRWAAAALVVAGTIVSAHALWQRTVGLEALAAEVAARADVADRDLVLARIAEGRPFAAFPTPAALAGFLGVAMAATAGMAWASRGGVRVACAGALLLQAAALVATGSAAGAAALAGAVVLRVLAHGRGSRRIALGAVLLAVVLVAGAVLVRSVRALDPSDAAGPWRLRAGNWRIAAEMARDHPLMGVGPGGYGESYGLYRRAGDNQARHAHQVVLELVAETGIPLGVLLSGAFLVAFLLPVVREGRGDPLRTGIAVGLACFALHNLVDFTAFLPSLLWTAAVLRGLLGGGEHRPGEAGVPVLAVALTGAAALLAAAAGLAGDARADARGAQAGADRGRAERASAEAVRLAPWDVEGRGVRARALLDGGRAREALLHADAAVVLSPVRADLRALRSAVRLRVGDLPGATADAACAARLHRTQEAHARWSAELEAAVRHAYGLGGAR